MTYTEFWLASCLGFGVGGIVGVLLAWFLRDYCEVRKEVD